MAQERWWNWQDDDSTFRLNWRDLGIHDPGRYRGFEGDLSFAPLQLNLIHTATGITKTKLNLTTTPKIGVWLSKQGCVITEDSNIVIPITAGNTLPRIDLIVGQHEYTQIVGGTAATYSVITGTPSLTPVAPALPFPEKQVILGALYVPANMISLVGPGVVYTPAKVPYFAGTQLSLDDNSDCTVNNAQNGDILLHDGVDFKNTNGKNYIQNLNIKMNNAFEQKALSYPNALSVPIIVSGGANIFNETTANTYIFDWNYTGAAPLILAGLPNSYQLGTEIYFIVKSQGIVSIKLNHSSTGPNHLPIQAFNYNSYNIGNQDGTNYYMLQAAYTKYKFTRMSTFWLMTEEKPIQNGLPILSWLLVYFPDIVRGSGPTGFTVGGLGTVGNSGLLAVNGVNIMRTANDAGYRIDFPIPLPSTSIGLNYIVLSSIYSSGTTPTEGDYANDITGPIIQNNDNNGFEVYFREVASVVQTDMWIDFIIVPRNFTYKPI